MLVLVRHPVGAAALMGLLGGGLWGAELFACLGARCELPSQVAVVLPLLMGIDAEQAATSGEHRNQKASLRGGSSVNCETFARNAGKLGVKGFHSSRSWLQTGLANARSQFSRPITAIADLTGCASWNAAPSAVAVSETSSRRPPSPNRLWLYGGGAECG